MDIEYSGNLTACDVSPLFIKITMFIEITIYRWTYPNPHGNAMRDLFIKP